MKCQALFSEKVRKGSIYLVVLPHPLARITGRIGPLFASDFVGSILKLKIVNKFDLSHEEINSIVQYVDSKDPNQPTNQIRAFPIH